MIEDSQGPAAGAYRLLIPETIKAFVEAGARLYNHAVLVNQAGSAPIRAGAAFVAGRKLCKVHQDVLVFVKGCPRRAAAACGDVRLFEFGRPVGRRLG